MSTNYIVMLVILVIWVGIFFYLLRLDKKIKKLEKK
jgi:CcmD family protein